LTVEQALALDLPPLWGPNAQSALALWAAYRTEIKKPLKRSSWDALIRQWSDKPREFSAAVERSIANGYQGLFADTSKNGSFKVKLSATEIYEQKAVALWEKFKLEEENEEN